MDKNEIQNSCRPMNDFKLQKTMKHLDTIVRIFTEIKPKKILILSED
jgi:hypothetical protein